MNFSVHSHECLELVIFFSLFVLYTEQYIWYSCLLCSALLW